MGEAAYNLEMADFDKDGFDDLFVGTFDSGNLLVYRNRPGIDFELMWNSSLDGAGYTGTVADIDNNGYPDLIVGEEDSNGQSYIRILRNAVSASSTTTPTITPEATPTPSTVCEAETITVSPSGTLKLKRSKIVNVTITVTGVDTCSVEGETVTATINKPGQRCIVISPTSQETDENGQVTFTITALKKTGNARITFQAGSVKKVLTVKVRK